MAENYFEAKFTQEETCATEERARIETEEAERHAAETAERRAIADLQWSRDKAHHGVKPAEVWGEEDALLCTEFLAYMNARRIEGELPGSIKIDNQSNRRQDKVTESPKTLLQILGFKKALPPTIEYDIPMWSTSGYPLAYSDPFALALAAGFNKELASRPAGPPQPKPPVEMDVALCEDGLLRRIGGAKSLEVITSQGDVAVPLIGHFDYSISNRHTGHSVSGESSPAFTQTDMYATTFAAVFIRDETETVLTKMARSVLSK